MDIGFDPVWSPGKTQPEPGITGSHGLVDTGAAISCLDNLLAAELSLPVIDERPVSGADGKFKTNIYLAQVHIPGMGITLYGDFAGVNLKEGGQVHSAPIGL